MKRIAILSALANEWGSGVDLETRCPDDDVTTTLLEVLDILAAAGLEGAAEHAGAERAALTTKTAARAAAGELISYEEALAHAPNRAARRALEARGRCTDERDEDDVRDLPVRCELPHGHARSGLRNNEEHAARVGGSWIRW